MDSMQTKIKVDIFDLGEKIEKQFKKFKVIIEIKKYEVFENRIVFTLKTKGNTTEKKVRNIVSEVQRNLKLSFCQVSKNNFELFLVVAKENPTYAHLPAILNSQDYWDEQKQRQLPYIMGYDVWGELVIDDLAKFPHLLLGGSSNSGKTVGLQALIAGIASTKSPSEVNFVLVDVGAADLMVFKDLPHLSFPIIRDRIIATNALNALVSEMEQRINLEHTDPSRFRTLPRLVVVIDEFPALFRKLEKSEERLIADNISDLLQRGRHALIHLVLAAQNPTFANMHVDLGNITARGAFMCARPNFSETILGEKGAERLSGQGDMLFKSPQNSELQRIQGSYITKSELRGIAQRITKRWYRRDQEKFTLKIPDNLTRTTDAFCRNLSCSVVRKGPSQEDQLLASVIMWTFGRNLISANLLMAHYHLGWNKTNRLIKRLEELGIVEKLEAKLPRNVVPHKFEDISEELVKFLESTGYSKDDVITAFRKDSLPKQNPFAKAYSTPQLHKIRKKVIRRGQNLREQTQAQLPVPRPQSSGNDR